MTGILSDVRYAFRILSKTPAATGASILTLGLGIALTTTVFTVYDAVALRPLPVADSSHLFRAARYLKDSGRSDGFTFKEYEYVRDHSRTAASVIATSSLTPQSGSNGEVIQTRYV